MEIKPIPQIIVDPTNYQDGVFYFSNTADEDFTVLWNNIEYTFKAHTCSPILIPDATPVQVQEIRKRFAYKWAEQQWFAGKEYKRLVKIGKDKPATRDDKVLEPLIELCLTPLVKEVAKTKAVPRKEVKMRGSKAIGKNANLNYEFRDDADEAVRRAENAAA